jgi:thioredoxin reductase (NADPH)
MTAAVYALRADKTVLLIERGAFGGQMTFSPNIENFPGTVSASGSEIADKMVEQVINLGGEFELGEVTGIRDNGDTKTVIADCGEYETRAVVIATGVKHRMLGLDGEEELIGDGISFCAVCDGAFYKNKDVTVIGGGNSALQEAVMLSEYCTKVTVVQNLAYLTGEKNLVSILEKRDNVSFIYNSVAKELLGDNELTGIVIENTDGEKTTLTVDGVFVAIGQIPQNAPFSDVIKLNNYGYADAGEDCLTEKAGIFVAGDCRSKAIRQITTATGDGAVAALAACKYLDME